MVYYRFYDPGFKDDVRYKKGKLVRLKGMNTFTTLSDRQEQVDRIIENELFRLRKEGFNPITGLNATELTPAIKGNTPFLQALTEAEKRLAGSKSTKRDLKSILRFVTVAAYSVGLANTPVCQISRKHIKLILSTIEAGKKKESVHRYNKVRTYLMMLFKELVELEAVETNPVKEISKKQRVVPIRAILTAGERSKIDQHLQNNHRRFWLFTHIFFHSGARLAEMKQARFKDVDLQGQTFIVTVKKGKLFKQTQKPIKNAALPFWLESVKGAGKDDFIFSEGLKPGTKPINTDQITKRWRLHVKQKMGIKADFYSLKHLHLDEMAAMLSLNDAAAMASHTSSKITLKHYTVNERQRQNERLKGLNNSFA